MLKLRMILEARSPQAGFNNQNISCKGQNQTNNQQQKLINAKPSDSSKFNYPLEKDRLFPRSVVRDTLKWRKADKPGVGYFNLGATCYLDTSLQCLTHTPPLSQILMSNYHSYCSVPNCFVCVFHKHINQAFTSTNAFAPKHVVSRLKLIGKQFHFHRQEDCHEFIRCFLDSIHKSCLYIAGHNPNERSAIAETSLIYQVFGGYNQSIIECPNCHYKSKKYDPILDISLEMNKSLNTLQDLFKYHNRIEQLSDDNKWLCSGCNKKTRGLKSLSIYCPPMCLCIQLKRFNYAGEKISKKIEYPVQFDIKPFISKDQAKKINSTSLTYSLYAVAVHDGYSVHSGHYYAYFKGRNGLWYCGDDQSVYQSKLTTALNQNAYVLFYMIDKPELLDSIIPFEKEYTNYFQIPKPVVEVVKPKVETINKLDSDDDNDANIKDLSLLAQSFINNNNNNNGILHSDEEKDKSDSDNWEVPSEESYSSDDEYGSGLLSPENELKLLQLRDELRYCLRFMPYLKHIHGIRKVALLKRIKKIIFMMNIIGDYEEEEECEYDDESSEEDDDEIELEDDSSDDDDNGVIEEDDKIPELELNSSEEEKENDKGDENKEESDDDDDDESSKEEENSESVNDEESENDEKESDDNEMEEEESKDSDDDDERNDNEMEEEESEDDEKDNDEKEDENDAVYNNISTKDGDVEIITFDSLKEEDKENVQHLQEEINKILSGNKGSLYGEKGIDRWENADPNAQEIHKNYIKSHNKEYRKWEKSRQLDGWNKALDKGKAPKIKKNKGRNDEPVKRQNPFDNPKKFQHKKFKH